MQNLTEQNVRAVRSTVPREQLMTAQGSAMADLYAALKAHDAEPAGPPYVRYHTFAEETDVEIGVPVTGAELATGTLPGGPAAVHTHLGGHDRLGEAYEELGAAVQASGLAAAGPGWEVYHWIDLRDEPNPAAWPAPADWRTDLVQPLR